MERAVVVVMERAVVVVMEVVAVVVLLCGSVQSAATVATQGCSAHHLTGKEGATSSPCLPLSAPLPLALRSPLQPWQEFSFAFWDSDGFPHGSLKVARTDEGTELSLQAWTQNDPNLVQDRHNQTVTLTQDAIQHLALKNWTFISFSVSVDQLHVTFDDLTGDPIEVVFGEVIANQFIEVSVRVPPEHSVFIALNCNQSEILWGKMIPDISTTTSPGDGDDPRSRTPVVVVSLVVLGLLLIVGVWYWRGRGKSRQGMNDRKPEEVVGDAVGATGSVEGQPLMTDVVVERDGRNESQNDLEAQNGVDASTSHEQPTSTAAQIPSGAQDQVQATADPHSDTDDETQSTHEVQKSTQSIYEPE